MKKGYVISFLLGLIVMTCIGVYAINASEIIYKETTIEGALDTLYGKAHLTATQVATLTTQGSTYTMQNEGYAIGSFGSNGSTSSFIRINGNNVSMVPYNSNSTFNVSLFLNKDDVLSVSESGIYNITVYEWK